MTMPKRCRREFRFGSAGQKHALRNECALSVEIERNERRITPRGMLLL
jgi:hypothetical protein